MYWRYCSLALSHQYGNQPLAALYPEMSQHLTTSWWCHQMDTFSVTGPLRGEFTGPGEFPAQRPVTRSFDVFFYLRWWFETPSRSLWHQCNGSRQSVDAVLTTKLRMFSFQLFLLITMIFNKISITILFLSKSIPHFISFHDKIRCYPLIFKCIQLIIVLIQNWYFYTTVTRGGFH